MEAKPEWVAVILALPHWQIAPQAGTSGF